MRILAIERPIPGVEDAQFTPELATAESRRAWELYQAGTIRDLYFRADESSAVLVLECQDVAAALNALASLPLVASRLDPVRGATAAGLPRLRAALRAGRAAYRATVRHGSAVAAGPGM